MFALPTFRRKRRPPLMKFYCGIDLSARDCHVCVIDEQLKIVIEQKLRNELTKICQLLEPYKAKLKIVVESTFNWYWLIDGLQAEGFEVVLAHTLGLYLITGAKLKTDRRVLTHWPSCCWWARCPPLTSIQSRPDRCAIC